MIHALASYVEVKSILDITAKAAFKRKKYLKDERDILRMKFFYSHPPPRSSPIFIWAWEFSNKEKVELMSFPAETFSETEEEIK